jgi:fructokinase
MPSTIDPARPVLCFGEMLWDDLPSGRRPGGAPMNVACHLVRLGRPAQPVSAVGTDDAGCGLRKFLTAHGVATTTVALLPSRPTGVVRARIDAAGNAHYTIEADAAWDDIPVEGPALTAAASAAALVFGSLAQRSPANRTALARLRAALPPDARLIFDVNLRPPHDDLDRVRTLARGVHVLKVNHEEAARLVGGAPDALETNARALASSTGAVVVCLTAGADGAGLLHQGIWLREPGRPITVADTVGAGDAFLAALTHGLLADAPPAETLARACRLGEWVASQPGAIPPPPGG